MSAWRAERVANPHKRPILGPRAARLLRHPLAPVLLAALAFAAIGLALPPRASDAATGPALGAGASGVELAPAEDMEAFRTLSRWGTNIQSVEQAASSPDQPVSGLNPELVKLGFIGLSATANEHAVLLTHPDGHTGSPDRRRLAARRPHPGVGDGQRAHPRGRGRPTGDAGTVPEAFRH